MFDKGRPHVVSRGLRMRGSEAKKFKGATFDAELYRDVLSVYRGRTPLWTMTQVHLGCLLGLRYACEVYDHGERMRKTHKKQVTTS